MGYYQCPEFALLCLGTHAECVESQFKGLSKWAVFYLMSAEGFVRSRANSVQFQTNPLLQSHGLLHVASTARLGCAIRRLNKGTMIPTGDPVPSPKVPNISGRRQQWLSLITPLSCDSDQEYKVVLLEGRLPTAGQSGQFLLTSFPALSH